MFEAFPCYGCWHESKGLNNKLLHSAAMPSGLPDIFSFLSSHLQGLLHESLLKLPINIKVQFRLQKPSPGLKMNQNGKILAAQINCIILA